MRSHQTSPHRLTLHAIVNLILGTGLGLGSLVPSRAEDASAAKAPKTKSSAISPLQAPALPFVAAEVVRLKDAGVGEPVIRAYIDQNSIPYDLRASDIVALQQRGVAPELVVALIQRNGSLRTQQGSAAAQPPAQPPVAQAPIIIKSQQSPQPVNRVTVIPGSQPYSYHWYRYHYWYHRPAYWGYPGWYQPVWYPSVYAWHRPMARPFAYRHGYHPGWRRHW